MATTTELLMQAKIRFDDFARTRDMQGARSEFETMANTVNFGDLTEGDKANWELVIGAMRQAVEKMETPASPAATASANRAAEKAPAEKSNAERLQAAKDQFTEQYAQFKRATTLKEKAVCLRAMEEFYVNAHYFIEGEEEKIVELGGKFLEALKAYRDIIPGFAQALISFNPSSEGVTATYEAFQDQYLRNNVNQMKNSLASLIEHSQHEATPAKDKNSMEILIPWMKNHIQLLENAQREDLPPIGNNEEFIATIHHDKPVGIVNDGAYCWMIAAMENILRSPSLMRGILTKAEKEHDPQIRAIFERLAEGLRTYRQAQIEGRSFARVNTSAIKEAISIALPEKFHNGAVDGQEDPYDLISPLLEMCMPQGKFLQEQWTGEIKDRETSQPFEGIIQTYVDHAIDTKNVDDIELRRGKIISGTVQLDKLIAQFFDVHTTNEDGEAIRTLKTITHAPENLFVQAVPYFGKTIGAILNKENKLRGGEWVQGRHKVRITGIEPTLTLPLKLTDQNDEAKYELVGCEICYGEGLGGNHYRSLTKNDNGTWVLTDDHETYTWKAGKGWWLDNAGRLARDGDRSFTHLTMEIGAGKLGYKPPAKVLEEGYIFSYVRMNGTGKGKAPAPVIEEKAGPVDDPATDTIKQKLVTFERNLQKNPGLVAFNRLLLTPIDEAVKLAKTKEHAQAILHCLEQAEQKLTGLEDKDHEIAIQKMRDRINDYRTKIDKLLLKNVPVARSRATNAARQRCDLTSTVYTVGAIVKLPFQLMGKTWTAVSNYVVEVIKTKIGL